MLKDCQMAFCFWANHLHWTRRQVVFLMAVATRYAKIVSGANFNQFCIMESEVTQ